MTSHIFLALLFFQAHFYSVQGLSKITIGLKPYQYQYVQNQLVEPTPLPEDEIPAFRVLEIQTVAPVIDRAELAYKAKEIENTAYITSEELKPLIPKKRKMKRKSKLKPKRKPKKMHLRRIYRTRLITTTPRPIMIEENRIDVETTTNIINLAPIYDAESGISYNQDELNRICTETLNVSKGFGISDIQSFAKNNCFLIRLYYPSVTCSQINQLIEYCTSNGLING